VTATPTAVPSRQALVLLGAGTVMILWSGTAIANKIAVGHMDPMTAGILRSLLAGLIAAAAAAVARLPLPENKGQWALLVVSGITSFAVWPTMLSLGLGRTSASHAALIMAMIPVFTGLIAAAFERRRPQVAWWIGVIVAIAGTAALVSYRGGGLDGAGATLAGDLIILSGVAICALGYVAGGRLSPVLGTWSTTFWGLAIATTVLVPSFLWRAGETDWAAVSAPGWAAIAYLTIGSSLLGYALWFWSLGRGGIARIGALQFTQPVLTLAFAVPILGERLTWPLVLSGAVILVGVAITQRQGR
jgi:drug/metabolite transporter (DMT)-like permease